MKNTDTPDPKPDPSAPSAPEMPSCPCCKSNARVTISPRTDLGAWFCPCNEPGPQYFDTSLQQILKQSPNKYAFADRAMAWTARQPHDDEGRLLDDEHPPTPPPTQPEVRAEGAKFMNTDQKTTPTIGGQEGFENGLTIEHIMLSVTVVSTKESAGQFDDSIAYQIQKVMPEYHGVKTVVAKVLYEQTKIEKHANHCECPFCTFHAKEAL